MEKKVLIVEDSRTMLNMEKMTLEQDGWSVSTAKDGQDAINVMNHDGGTYDLIVTDINMPNLDGLSLIKIIRRKSDNKNTPILVVTTEGGEIKKDKGKRVGASAWITKPFEPAVLLDAAKRLTGL